MLTIVETPEFLRAAKKLLTEGEIEDLKNTLACNPKIGDLIKGTGGFRKIRLARQGTGKRGGYRVIYFFHNENLPLFLFTVYAKAEKENLSQAECNMLRKIAAMLANYGG